MDLKKEEKNSTMEKMDKSNTVDKIFDVILVIVKVIVKVLVPLVVMIMITNIIFKEWKEQTDTITTEKRQIISIDFQNEIEGDFVIGLGDLENKYYFFVYEILADGGKKLAKYPADKSIIYDILPDDETAYVEIDTNGTVTVKSIRIYVPKDVITKEYKLN